MLLNSWSFFIITANIVNLTLSLNKIGASDNESETESRARGLAAMLYWISLNKYFVYSP